MPLTNNKRWWEDEIRRRYTEEIQNGGRSLSVVGLIQRIKDIESTTIRNTEKDMVERMVGLVEKQKINKMDDPFIANFKPVKEHVTGYNKACADLLLSLQGLLDKKE